MKIVLFQRDIVWADPEANRALLRSALAGAPDADLYVLPEMFSTGFVTSPEGVAEESPSATLALMKELVATRNAALAGSIALHDTAPVGADASASASAGAGAASAGRFVNRFYFVKPDGGVEYYDKKHLFTYSGEHLRYSPGDRRVVVSWRGVRFLLEVCYDLRFPVWSRNRLVPCDPAAPSGQLRPEYDAILYVASWPTPRRAAWDTLLRARAIENQCYVCGVNRVGKDPSCEYSGGTAFIDPYGKVAAACPDGEDSYIACEIDMDALEAFRAKFPVLFDADDLQ